MAEDAGAAPPLHQKLEGSRDYEAAIDTLVASAKTVLRIFDQAAGTRYNSLKRYELLRKFLLASRRNRLYLVFHDVDNLARDCPRLMTLVRDFGHAVSINQTQAEAKGVYDPFAIADESHFLHRFHYDDSRGLLALDDPHGALQFLQRYEALWEASSPAVSATTLGL